MQPRQVRVNTAHQWNSRLKSHEYTQRRLTFGRYAGRMIQDVPTDYIKWGIINLDDVWAGFMARELQRRDRAYK